MDCLRGDLLEHGKVEASSGLVFLYKHESHSKEQKASKDCRIFQTCLHEYHKDEAEQNLKVIGKILKDLCKKKGINCYDLMASFTGLNCCLNSSTIELFLKHDPQQTATKNMIHMSQNGTIAMYDYGDDDDNTKHYGQPKPPIYDMTNIPDDIPLFLSYGGKDALSDVKDVEILLEILKSHDSDKLTVQYRDDYAHADFVMGVNANQVVYEPMITFFKLQLSK